MVDITTASATSGLPVVVIRNVTPADVHTVRSIYGVTKKGNLWIAPGFLPFVQWVLEDINALSSKTPFVEGAKFKALRAKVQGDMRSLVDQDLQGYIPKVPCYQHQIEALSLALHLPRLGLFLDPGLGKTKVGCDLIQHVHKEDGKRFWLIVALRVNQFTWAKEMAFHSEGELELIPLVATGKARARKIDEAMARPNCVGLVVTYDTCRVAQDLLLDKVPYTDVILDESHSLRTPRSGKTKAVLELLKKKPVARRLLLSGTPSLGSPQHLWAQLKALGDFVVPNSWHFLNTYAIRSPYNQHIITGYKRLDELNDLVTSVSLRKTAQECLDLPERTTQIIEVPSTPKTRKAYNTTVSGKPITLGPVDLAEVPNPLTVMTRLAQISMGFAYKSLRDPNICDGCTFLDSCVANGTQPYTRGCQVETVDPGREVGLVGSTEVLDAVLELVDSHIQAKKKVIVWGKHQWVLEQLETRIKKLDVPVFTYNSTTKHHTEVEDAFNLCSEGVIVAQVSMGIGVTFKAPVMVYAELSWSLDHWLQSLDRNYGIRAKGLGKLLVQSVVLRQSISHSAMRLLQAKIDVSSLMSKSVECVGCDRVLGCLVEAISPFDPKCILKPSSTKTTLPITPID
jgi:hypothetical protein